MTCIRLLLCRKHRGVGKFKQKKEGNCQSTTRRDKRSHVDKLAKSAEDAAIGDMAEVYKIIKKLVNTNTMADSPVLDLNENILSTDEEKLNRWREHFESVVSSEGTPFAPTTETISPA